MRILLDSHTLLWSLHAPEKLNAAAAEAIRDPRNTVYFSAASAWELELKAAKGKLRLPPAWLDTATETGFLQIPVTAGIAQASTRLPWHHNDPFDRVIVAQAVELSAQVATRDELIHAYDITVLEA